MYICIYIMYISIPTARRGRQPQIVDVFSFIGYIIMMDS